MPFEAGGIRQYADPVFIKMRDSIHDFEYDLTAGSVSDSPMYHRSGDEPDTNIYFQKIRACADFALEIPYNPVKIKSDMKTILDGMSEHAKTSLEKQIENFAADLVKYCG